MRGSRLLLLLLSATIVRGDFFHHLYLKKVLTYAAFARALMRRPTILPIPIPIPIPISQNEVIKLPASGGKSYINLAGGGDHSYLTGGKSDIFTGSSDFGYSIPGSFDGGSSSFGGGSNIMLLDSNNLQSLSGAEGVAASSSNVVRLVPRKPQFLKLAKPIFPSFGFKKTTMRNSGNAFAARPLMEAGLGSYSIAKKPIPVGERFRLP